MGKGGYRGGGTIIGPGDHEWFGKGGPTDGSRKLPPQPRPLSAKADQEITDCRKQVHVLEGHIRSFQAVLDAEKAKLKGLLLKYGQPLDDGLV